VLAASTRVASTRVASTTAPLTAANMPQPTAAPAAAASTGTRPTTLAGIPIEQFVVLNDDTRAHIQAIYALGQMLGRDANAFSKLGDSTIENPYFMDRFDEPGGYHLAEWDYLQPTIDWFAGSFSRDSVAVRVGLHTWSVFDPMWAGRGCLGGENVLECEVRLHNPVILIVRLSANDVGVPQYVEDNFRRIIEWCLENGVIPVIGTKGDRHEGSNINNEIMRRLAAEYNVPLWDFDLLAATIPGRGLTADGAHMTTFYAHDWSQPSALQTGHGMHTLAGLILLDELRRALLPTPPAEFTPETTALPATESAAP
jgi:hypothetical protein